MFYPIKKTFAGHIKVLGGPHVARGPDVAQVCHKVTSVKLGYNDHGYNEFTAITKD